MEGGVVEVWWRCIYRFIVCGVCMWETGKGQSVTINFLIFFLEDLYSFKLTIHENVLISRENDRLTLE